MNADPKKENERLDKTAQWGDTQGGSDPDLSGSPPEAPEPDADQASGIHLADTVDSHSDSAGQPAVDSPLLEKVGRYRIDGVLGAGGYGRVYLAHDEQLERRVAVKVPHRKYLTSQAVVDDYLHEARTLAKLDHPSIVPVYDAGQAEDGTCFIVSKYLEGESLAELIQRDRPPLVRAARIVASIAEALHYAHTRNLVHRDVKPANILMDSEGRPYLADFGLALRHSDYGTGPQFSGTPLYMSPEQARGEGHLVDGRSDIYSLGVVLYEMILGVRPFDAGSAKGMIERIANLDVRPLRQVDDTLPIEVERICLKALARRPAERYSTAKDLAEDLHRFLNATSRGEEIVELVETVRRPAAPPVAHPTDGPSPAFLAADVAGPRASCRFCGCTEAPVFRKRISTAGWITFGVLLVFCFPFSLIGLFFKEDYLICSHCHQPLN